MVSEDYDYPNVPVTELRDSLGNTVAEVAEGGRPVIITQRGRAVAALVPMQMFTGAALPPAYFDDRSRHDAIAQLDSAIGGYPAEERAAAEEWARHALPDPTADHSGNHDAA